MPESSFLARNKTAIVAAALASASAVGAYYYYAQSQATTAASEPASKKKKSKKKKSTKGAGDSNGTKANGETSKKDTTSAAEAKAPYPVNSQGFPEITEELIAKLSDLEKEEWALSLKKAGNDRYKAENFEDAITFYSAALQVKQDPVFYSNRSACYAALDKHEQVIEDATAAINIKRDYVKCILRRANSYEALEKYPESMLDLTALTIFGGFNSKSVEQSLEKVLQKHSLKIVEANLKNRVPELPSASTIGSFFGTYVPETAPEGISEESTGGDKFLFEALANIDANTVEGYENADSLLNQAVKAYNIDSLDKTSSEAATASIALEYLAAFKFMKNEPTEASALIDQAVALKPRPRTYIMRALINADKSSFTEALADFELAQKPDPENGDVYYHLGQLYYLTSDLDKAEENFKKAKQYNPENLYAYIQLACIIYKQGKFEESEKSFNEARLKFPTSPEILNYYGEILADHGDIQGAIKQYEIAARLQEALPNYSVGAVPLINKASLISREGPEQLPIAEELLTKACELDPKSEIARISLAQVKLQTDKPEEAVALFEEGSDLARTFEEKVQATSFAEATKMQLKIKADPVLSAKVREYLAASM
ncbi:TPR-like protein [Metschnikowia bicuspidata var. bicuspidata NRRL YB-4993]|uniref:TPR-like protein n=1 Tax=Metschnikowia bicuspidata var. bicuspidata NRRL YB-4993 TaxID=869754 RepID=A0A1A0HCJ2_9ASCO|nr:TPR-like protein [Metschnikowia bicuspidata var. bicuspidata NRRL YB-4993]OBA21701.1 TPR-like protein [Metschnikowia bicuspidata var. bicuspidata NRRL YB-4993]